MQTLPSYDGDLEMYRELPASVSMTHLRFVRWLVEQGRLEHPPAGPAAGAFASATQS